MFQNALNNNKISTQKELHKPPFTMLGLVIFFLLKLILLFFNTFVLNFLYIKESWKMCHCFHRNIQKQLFSTLIIIVSWAANHHIKMISEESCDTKDWCNDAENLALNHRTKLHLEIYLNLLFIEMLLYKISVTLQSFRYCYSGKHGRLT